MDDPYNLQRFVAAQDSDGTYAQALEELRRGRETSHWMWFVFPQIAGLGSSSLSRRYAISSLAEAQAYLRHPVLGPRLVESARVVAESRTPSAEQLLGGIDAQKLRSSMTLFSHADRGQDVFQAVLDRYYQGAPDTATEARLGPTQESST